MTSWKNSCFPGSNNVVYEIFSLTLSDNIKKASKYLTLDKIWLILSVTVMITWTNSYKTEHYLIYSKLSININFLILCPTIFNQIYIYIYINSLQYIFWFYLIKTDYTARATEIKRQWSRIRERKWNRIVRDTDPQIYTNLIHNKQIIMY